MGTLRDKATWPDKILNGYGASGVCMDCPQWPAQVLLDDINQEMVVDVGLDLDEGLYMYKIVPYPESHHI